MRCVHAFQFYESRDLNNASYSLNHTPLGPTQLLRISHNYDVFLGDGAVRLLGENFVLTVGILILH
jgi:hypothetical protein